MAFLLDENKLINDNVFKFEERMNSQYTRFIDKSPTFVKYFNINNIESTADNGFNNVERILGPDSPIRFKQVSNFPVYGLDQILIELDDTDQGIDGSYEGEVIVLPNTLEPLPNDFFTINYLSKDYLFMVTKVEYDTIKSNNYYKVSFTLRSTDGSGLPDLINQVVEKYNCILTNIGTKEKCLIREDEVELLLALNKVYGNIAQRYQTLFYNSRYNNFLYVDVNTGNKVYDKYMSNFINTNGLFNQKNDFNTLYLNIEDKTPAFPIEYEDSFYRALELNRKSYVRAAKCYMGPVRDYTSIFSFYRDSRVISVKMDQGTDDYLPQQLIDAISSGDVSTLTDIRYLTIANFFNNKITSVYEIDLESLNEFSSFIRLDKDTFTLVPIVMYILRYLYNKFMSVE